MGNSPATVEEAVGVAAGEVVGLLSALSDNFMQIIPVGLILIGLVAGVFWLIGRARKFASTAR